MGGHDGGSRWIAEQGHGQPFGRCVLVLEELEGQSGGNGREERMLMISRREKAAHRRPFTPAQQLMMSAAAQQDGRLVAPRRFAHFLEGAFSG